MTPEKFETTAKAFLDSFKEKIQSLEQRFDEYYSEIAC